MSVRSVWLVTALRQLESEQVVLLPGQMQLLVTSNDLTECKKSMLQINDGRKRQDNSDEDYLPYPTRSMKAPIVMMHPPIKAASTTNCTLALHSLSSFNPACTRTYTAEAGNIHVQWATPICSEMEGKHYAVSHDEGVARG